MEDYFTTTLGDAYGRLVQKDQFIRVTLRSRTSSHSRTGSWITQDHKIETKDASPDECFGYQLVIFSPEDDCIISDDTQELVRVYDSRIELYGGDTIEPMTLHNTPGLDKKAKGTKVNYSAKYAFGEMTLRDFHKATRGRTTAAEIQFENAARSGIRPVKWSKTNLVIDMEYDEIKIPLASKVKKIDGNAVEATTRIGSAGTKEERVLIRFYQPCNAEIMGEGT